VLKTASVLGGYRLIPHVEKMNYSDSTRWLDLMKLTELLLSCNEDRFLILHFYLKYKPLRYLSGFDVI